MILMPGKLKSLCSLPRGPQLRIRMSLARMFFKVTLPAAVLWLLPALTRHLE